MDLNGDVEVEDETLTIETAYGVAELRLEDTEWASSGLDEEELEDADTSELLERHSIRVATILHSFFN